MGAFAARQRSLLAFGMCDVEDIFHDYFSHTMISSTRILATSLLLLAQFCLKIFTSRAIIIVVGFADFATSPQITINSLDKRLPIS